MPSLRVTCRPFEVCRRICHPPVLYMWGAVGCRPMAQIRMFLSLHVQELTVTVFWLRDSVFGVWCLVFVVAWHTLRTYGMGLRRPCAARPASAERCERTVSWNESDA